MREVRISQTRLVAMIGAGALIGSIAGSIGLSFADNLSTTSSVLDGGVTIPYDGVLILDSAPVNAVSQNLEFALYESPTGGAAQWVERHNVSVNNGKFGVALGQGTKISSSPSNASFNQVILDAEKLYIGISVDDGTGTYIELAGRQTIEAAPFAAWAATSADFNVERNLLVKSNAQINGGLSTNTASVNSTMSVGGLLTVNDSIRFGTTGEEITRVAAIKGEPSLGLYGNALGGGTGDIFIASTGDVSISKSVTVSDEVIADEFNGALTPRYQDWDSQGTGAGGAGIYNDGNGYKTLMVVGNNSAGGVTRNVNIYDDLYVNGKYKNLQNTMVLSQQYQRASPGTTDMINTDDGFCFLTSMSSISLDQPINIAQCLVVPDSGKWRLIHNSTLNQLVCQAYCVNLK